MTADTLARQRRRTLWVYRAVALGFLAFVAAWPMANGPALRARFARAALAAKPGWQHAALPAVSLAYARAQRPQAVMDLEGARSLVRTWRGKGAELTWAALALAEAKAGRAGRARQAWLRAVSIDPAVSAWLASPRLAVLARAVGN